MFGDVMITLSMIACHMVNTGSFVGENGKCNKALNTETGFKP